MPVPTAAKATTPFATADDTTSGLDAEVTVHIKLVGAVAQVQADYATLAGTSLTADSVISWD